MKFEIEGKVVQVFETKQVSEKFSKREFVLETEDGRYTQTLLFESSGRMIEDLDDIRANDKVVVHFNVRGRKWEKASGEVKYFNSLHAWKIERVGQKQAAPPPQTKQSETKPATSASGDYSDFDGPAGPVDDIPFATADMAHEPSPIAKLFR